MKRILLSLLMLISTTPLFAQEIHISHFVKRGDYLDMQLSPDGKHIAARVRVGGREMMAILDSATMKVVGGLKPANNDIIHTVNWISNERLVFEYAEKQSNFDRPVATGELYATNIDNSQRLMIYGYRAGDESAGSRLSSRKDSFATQEIISLLEGDDRHILILEHPWTLISNTWYDNRKKQPVVSKLNVYTGRKSKVETIPHPGATVLATKSGSINFIRWRNEQGYTKSAYRENEDDDWKPLNLESDEGRELFPMGLSEDEKYVYFSGYRGENSIYTYYALDLASGEISEVFGEHATDVEWLITDANGMPAVGETYPGKSEYVYAKGKSRTAKIHKMLVDAFGGQSVDIESRTEDGKTLLVRVSSDVNPGEYYFFDRDTLNAQFLWANKSWIDPRTLAPMQPIVVKSDDGQDLHGYLTLPKQTGDKKPPMVVMIHGGPQVRDFWAYNNEVQLFANRGYAVLQINYRGSDGYGQDFRNSSNREWGGKVINDITAATKWAIDQGYVDGDNICTFGDSFGGYAAVMSTIREQDLYKCAIGYVGIYDLQFAYTESDIPNNWGGQAYLERALGTDEAELKQYSPVHHADKIKAKVMLIHGSRDRRAPEINSEVLAEKLEDAGNPAVYLKYRQAGHGVYDEENQQELYEGVLKFLEQNLKKA